MRKKRKNSNPIYNLQGSTLWKKKIIKNLFYNNLKKIFLLGQRLGIHIIPNHFYYPVPDTRTLREKVFFYQTKHIGIEFSDKDQLELLNLFSLHYNQEFNSFPRFKTNIPYQYYTTNGNFRSVDGEILYCMIRHFKPKKIIEIGSGYSTYCSAHAILKNKEIYEDYDCELIAIEPYPNETLRKGFPGLTKLIPMKLQDVPLEFFTKLTENDILFIDSSHILNIGSDVQYEFLEILPRLNPGVIVQIHDIFFPMEYPPEWVLNLFRFYNEQYLLQAFLTFNKDFKIIWGSKYMQLNYFDKLIEAFKSFKLDKVELKRSGFNSKNNDYRWPIEWPTSFWIKRVK